MKKRMLKIRLFAGGLAAVMSMSTLSSVAFAAEAEPIEQVIEAENPSTDYYTPEIIQENTLVTFENTQEATDEVNTNDVMNEMVTENEAETSATEEANTVAADVQVTEMSVADKAAVDEVAVDEVVDDAVVEDAENSTTTDKEALDILVAKMDVENPVKASDTFVKEEVVDGALVRKYVREGRLEVERIFYSDGRFVEKILTPGLLIHPPKIAGNDNVTQKAGEVKVTPSILNSERTYNLDGTWTETTYDKGVEKSKTDYTAEEMHKIIKAENQTLHDLYEAKRIEESASLEEILDFFSNLNKDGTGVIAENADSIDSTEEVKKEMPSGDIPPIIKKAYSMALDKAIAKMPGGAIIGDTVKNIVLKAMHLDTPQQDPNEAVLKRIDEAQHKTEQLLSSNKRVDIIVNAIGTTGQALDSFTNSCTTLAQEIYNVRNKNSSGKISETSMLVNIAKKIGSPDQWINSGSHIFSKLSDAAAVLGSTANNGTSSDPNKRNIYQLFFDYNKESSMFSGEAIDKSAGQLQQRIQDFALNCDVLMEVLNIHEKVANFTDEQIDSLTNEEDKAFCRKVKNNKSEIEDKKHLVTCAFTGDKTSEFEKARYGIIDAVRQYNSQSRTVFFEQTNTGFNEVALSTKVYTQKSEKTNMTTLKSHSGLSVDQLYKLQKHVNGMGITMEEYLDQVGFDLSPIKNTDRKAYLSTLSTKTKSFHSGRGKGHGYCSKSYTGINMREKNAAESSQYSFYKYKGYFWEKDEDTTYRDGILVVLQKEK